MFSFPSFCNSKLLCWTAFHLHLELECRIRITAFPNIPAKQFQLTPCWIQSHRAKQICFGLFQLKTLTTTCIGQCFYEHERFNFLKMYSIKCIQLYVLLLIRTQSNICGIACFEWKSLTMLHHQMCFGLATYFLFTVIVLKASEKNRGDPLGLILKGFILCF